MTQTPRRTAPQHVAIIMDGNGRFATAQGLPRTAGHTAGAETMRRIIEHVATTDTAVLTLWAFSTDNWKRPPAEVEHIMQLVVAFIANELPALINARVRLSFIGDRTCLSTAVQEALTEAEVTTSAGDSLYVQIGLNYGGRDEIVRACNQVRAHDGPITEAVLAAALDTAAVPDPELIIRTGGEVRTSGFLLWQSVHSEWYFSDTFWPDFSPTEFDQAVADFMTRDRRYGGLTQPT